MEFENGTIITHDSRSIVFRSNRDKFQKTQELELTGLPSDSILEIYLLEKYITI